METEEEAQAKVGLSPRRLQHERRSYIRPQGRVEDLLHEGRRDTRPQRR